MKECGKDIVRDLINEGEPAFTYLFNFYYPRLYHFVRAYLPIDDLAENIVQDTFTILWNKRKVLREDSNLNAWLYTVARNECLKQMRNEKVRNLYFSSDITHLELELNIEALLQIDTSNLTFSEITRIVKQTMDHLPDRCRTVFHLSRFEEKTNKEIAAELGISEKAVEKHITKALRVFRANLKDYLPLLFFIFVR